MNVLQSIRLIISATVVVSLVAASAVSAPRDRTPPTTPTNLRVTGASDYSISLAWNASTDDSGFWYYRLVSSSGTTISLDLTQTSHSFTTGLDSGGTYSFYIYALDGRGNRSKNSNAASATLLPAGSLPSAPAVTAADVGPTHVSLAWTAPFDAGPPVRYWLYWNGQPLATWHQTTSFTLYFAEPQTTHTFTVQARDGKGRFSPHSALLTVTTPQSDPNDTTPPSTPASVWVSDWGDGSTEFELNWTASTDNVTPPEFIRYDVYLNGVWLDATVGRTRIIGYAEFGENTLEVIAGDEAGNESSAASVGLSIP